MPEFQSVMIKIKAIFKERKLLMAKNYFKTDFMDIDFDNISIYGIINIKI